MLRFCCEKNADVNVSLLEAQYNDNTLIFSRFFPSECCMCGLRCNSYLRITQKNFILFFIIYLFENLKNILKGFIQKCILKINQKNFIITILLYKIFTQISNLSYFSNIIFLKILKY